MALLISIVFPLIILLFGPNVNAWSAKKRFNAGVAIFILVVFYYAIVYWSVIITLIITYPVVIYFSLMSVILFLFLVVAKKWVTA